MQRIVGSLVILCWSAACASQRYPGPDGPELSPLEQAALICPSQADEQLANTLCAPDMPAGPSRNPGPGQMADVNRLPDSIFTDMLLDEAQFASCRDLFADDDLQGRLAPITVDLLKLGRRWPAASKVSDIARLRLLSAVGDMSWSYCHRINQTEWATIHATYLPEKRSAILYSTACNAESLYGQRIKSLDFGHRFFMITAHELGHGIDAAVGQLPRVSNAAAELRATWYGTFFAQCSSRLWQKILLDTGSVDTTSEQKRVRNYWIDEWKSFEKRLGKLRTDIDEGAVDSRSPSLGLSQAFSCATPR